MAERQLTTTAPTALDMMRTSRWRCCFCLYLSYSSACKRHYETCNDSDEIKIHEDGRKPEDLHRQVFGLMNAKYMQRNEKCYIPHTHKHTHNLYGMLFGIVSTLLPLAPSSNSFAARCLCGICKLISE